MINKLAWKLLDIVTAYFKQPDFDQDVLNISSHYAKLCQYFQARDAYINHFVNAADFQDLDTLALYKQLLGSFIC